MMTCKDCISYAGCIHANPYSKPCVGFEEKKLIKDKECLGCEEMLDCKGKPKNVERCNRFKERKDE